LIGIWTTTVIFGRAWAMQGIDSTGQDEAVQVSIVMITF
jgi:hypothetical protein